MFRHINWRSREGWRYLWLLGWGYSPIMLWPVAALIAAVCLLVSLAAIPFRNWWLAAQAAELAPFLFFGPMIFMAVYYYISELLMWLVKRRAKGPVPWERPLPKKHQGEDEKKDT